MKPYILPAPAIFLLLLGAAFVGGLQKVIRSDIDESAIAWQGRCRPIGLKDSALQVTCNGRTVATADGMVLYQFGKGTLTDAQCSIYRDGHVVCAVPKAKKAGS